jgi:hypothetical protein
MVIAARRSFQFGTLEASFSKADARDLDSADPTPEAPRIIFEVLGTIQKLPFHLEAKGEFEYVGTKPLGTGCDARGPERLADMSSGLFHWLDLPGHFARATRSQLLPEAAEFRSAAYQLPVRVAQTILGTRPQPR